MGEKKPALRFKGFEGEWKSFRLGDIATMKARIGWQGLKQTEFLTTGDYYLITGTDFENGGVNFTNCHYIDKIRYDQDTNIQVKNGDVLITKDGTIGKVAYIWNMDKLATLNAGIFVVKGKNEDASNLYLYHYLEAPYLLEYATRKEPGGTIKHLNQNVLVNFPILIPQIEEQKKLAEYLCKINDLITQHQLKYFKLERIKKSMLEKMFPKDGADIPEIRFKGFSGAWIRSKLSDVLVNRRILQRKSDEAPRLAFASGQGVIDLSERKTNNRDQLISDESAKYYLLTEYNDIVYNPANLKYGAIDRNKHGKGVISPIYVTFTTDEIPSFIERIVISERFKLKALLFEEGTVVKRQSVSPENLLSFEEMIAPSKDEQKKVGDYFDHLDTLINLHQKKLDHLKHIKSALLEKMFVQEAA